MKLKKYIIGMGMLFIVKIYQESKMTLWFNFHLKILQLDWEYNTNWVGDWIIDSIFRSLIFHSGLE